MDTEFKITLVIRMLEEVSVNFNKKKKKGYGKHKKEPVRVKDTLTEMRTTL